MKLEDLKGKKIGFSLAGGSLKGIASHLGFMMAMLKLGIKPYAIVGTSAGSDVGGYISLKGFTEESINRLYDIVINLTADDYVDKVSIFSVIYDVFHGLRETDSLIKGDKFEKFLNKLYNNAEFSDCKIPFYAHVFNVDKAREEIIEVGHPTTSMAKACHASSTIPAVFKPVTMLDRDGESCEFVDGGVVGLHAVEELVKRHPELDCVIVNDFHQHDEKKRSLKGKKYRIIKLIYRLYDGIADEFEDLRTEWLDNYGMHRIDVRPNIPTSVDLQKPEKNDIISVIEQGYNETLRIMNLIS